MHRVARKLVRHHVGQRRECELSLSRKVRQGATLGTLQQLMLLFVLMRERLSSSV